MVPETGQRNGSLADIHRIISNTLKARVNRVRSTIPPNNAEYSEFFCNGAAMITCKLPRAQRRASGCDVDQVSKQKSATKVG